MNKRAEALHKNALRMLQSLGFSKARVGLERVYFAVGRTMFPEDTVGKVITEIESYLRRYVDDLKPYNCIYDVIVKQYDGWDGISIDVFLGRR